MKRLVAAFIVIVGISGGGALAGDDATSAMTVEVQGVRVVKLLPGGNDNLRAFGVPAGTAVALLITAPQGGLVVFDSDSSRVKSSVDDKGKDLTKPEPDSKSDPGSENPGFFPIPMFSEDRNRCSLELSVPGIPTKQATALKVSGKIVFKIAKEKKDFAAEKVALQAGTTIDAGAILLTIKRVGKPDWGGDDKAIEVEFEANQNLDSIADIQFFDEAGKKIEAREGPRARWKSADDVVKELLGKPPEGDSKRPVWSSSMIAYRLKSKVDLAKIVITYWSDMKEVTVPFDLTVSLGL